MTHLKTLLLTAAVALTSGTAAFAHDSGNFNRAQSWQLREIEQARRAGQLTRHEYADLLAEQARIARLQESARADGYVSDRERRQIREAQKEAGAHIYNESHDRQVNYWRAWKWRYGNRY